MGAAGSAGAVGAGAGGGGGGAGSSFLPHPTNVRVNAKRVTADNKTSFFPILIHLLSRHTFTKPSLLRILYRTSRREFQAQCRQKLISLRSDFFSTPVGSWVALFQRWTMFGPEAIV
jgi:hypothetical protein